MGNAAQKSKGSETRGEGEVVNLMAKQLGAAGAQRVADELAANPNAAKLILGHNGIGADGCRAIASVLANHSTLRELYLAENEIGDDGCRAIANALKANTSLRELHIVGNGIGDDGCGAMAEALRSNATLTTLCLNSNRIGDEGCRAIADVLRSIGMLTGLFLYNNRIRDCGAKSLVSALERHDSSLLHIDLSSNPEIPKPTRARAIALVQLTREDIHDVPRHLVAELTDEILEKLELSTYKLESDVLRCECFTSFRPVLSALRELADNKESGAASK